MNIAIVFAGGTGTRMASGGTPKQFLDVHGRPIIVHTLEVIQRHPEMDSIVIPCVEGWHSHLADLVERFHLDKVEAILPGGADTQESKLNALEHVADQYAADDLVMLHDAVRPLITSKMITDNVECAREHGNAVSFVEFRETGIISDDRRTIDRTVSRNRLFTAAAPQTFRLQDALEAHRKGRGMPAAVTIDTCSLMTELGVKVHLVECETANIKITTPEDFYHFKGILSLRESREAFGL